MHTHIYICSKLATILVAVGIVPAMNESRVLGYANIIGRMLGRLYKVNNII